MKFTSADSKVKIPYYILLILCLNSCGGGEPESNLCLTSCDDSSEPESENSLFNDLCGTGVCLDVLGDAAFDFLDMGKLKIVQDNISITVEIELLTIPPLLTYNSYNYS